jgi:pimeloyl-ACP methyl ester carboxylesterase
MGNVVGNQVLFPAPESTYDHDLNGLVWDIQASTNITRPFLYIPYSMDDPTERPVTIIYLHANACDIGGMASELSDLSRACCVNVLAVEYPGYGVYTIDSTEPTAEGINQAAEHAVELLLAQGVHPHEMVFFGRSIGTGPATRLAKLFKSRGWTPYGLILQSPYISIHRVVADYMRLGTWLIPNHWDNKKGVEKLGDDVPLLIIHGEMDEIIPVSHGKELYTSSSSRKKHLVCPALATHNEWDLVQDVIKPIRDFIRRYRKLDDGRRGISPIRGF